MSRYALPADLKALSMNSAALAGIDDPTLQTALDAASDLADGYLRSRYTLPISVVSNDLKMRVCDIGAYLVLKARGFNPEGNEILVKGYDDSVKWLAQVADGKVSPALTDSSGTDVAPISARVITATPRGW